MKLHELSPVPGSTKAAFRQRPSVRLGQPPQMQSASATTVTVGFSCSKYSRIRAMWAVKPAL